MAFCDRNYLHCNVEERYRSMGLCDEHTRAYVLRYYGTNKECWDEADRIEKRQADIKKKRLDKQMRIEDDAFLAESQRRQRRQEQRMIDNLAILD